MNMLRRNNKYVPDVLDCLANLSSDEVFTPPHVVNQMLDMLPQEVFMSKETTFLDPCSKTGVFLREITKRLLSYQVPDYLELSNEIELLTKEAIQNAVRNGKLDLNDEDYEEKARAVGDAAIKNSPKALRYNAFERELQDALDHILTKQVFGIAITELTANLSRRSLYCSKNAAGKYSVSADAFGNVEEGNIRFVPMKHTWKNGNCIFCGASVSNLDRPDDYESHAYEFIHRDNLEDIFMGFQFTVVCGNPPYQLNLGNEGGNSAKAQAIYHQFINQAIRLNPRYLIMITPSRWMTRTQAGVTDSWVDKMLAGNHFIEIQDFENASECFPGVEIKGGVNYFSYSENYNGPCKYVYHDTKTGEAIETSMYLDSYGAGVVVRDPKAKAIVDTIVNCDGRYYLNDDTNFSGLVSPADYFTKKPVLTSNWDGFVLNQDVVHPIKCYLNKAIHKVGFGYVSKNDIPKNHDSIGLNKVYLPAAGGSGNDMQVLGYPFYGEPDSICSQTYRVIGYDPVKHNFTKEECENIISYIKTKFFRYLVSIKKKTQNGPRGVYQFVPLQDFSKPWTDEELYAKYNLTQEEIDFIESMIKPME